MNRQEEGEGEERGDDEVYEPDAHTSSRRRRLERPEVDLQRGNARVDGGGRAGHGLPGQGLVAHDLLRPLPAKLLAELRGEHVELRPDVVVRGRVLPGRLVYVLDRPGRAVRRVALPHGGAQQRRGVGVDDDGGPALPVIHGLADGDGVITKLGWVEDCVAQRRRRAVDELQRRVDHGLAYKGGPRAGRGRVVRGNLPVKVDDVDDKVAQPVLGVEQDAPVQREDTHYSDNEDEDCAFFVSGRSIYPYTYTSSISSAYTRAKGRGVCKKDIFVRTRLCPHEQHVLTHFTHLVVPEPDALVRLLVVLARIRVVVRPILAPATITTITTAAMFLLVLDPALVVLEAIRALPHRLLLVLVLLLPGVTAQGAVAVAVESAVPGGEDKVGCIWCLAAATATASGGDGVVVVAPVVSRMMRDSHFWRRYLFGITMIYVLVLYV